jgi:hypothetical protein
VFIASTFYDLRDLRGSLEAFVRRLGMEPVLAERGSVTYEADEHLDKSCYREVERCDILVLIIGGRYGSRASESDKAQPTDAAYESVTKSELKTALGKRIPVYILLKQDVQAEYRVWQRNRSAKVEWAATSDPEVFSFLEWIEALPIPRPVQAFTDASGVEEWLEEQWLGYFKLLLGERGEREQLRSMAAGLEEMREINETLKRYLELVVAQSASTEGDQLIKNERDRLIRAKLENALRVNQFAQGFRDKGLPPDDIVDCIREAKSFTDLADRLTVGSAQDIQLQIYRSLSRPGHPYRRDVNRLRRAMDKAILGETPDDPAVLMAGGAKFHASVAAAFDDGVIWDDPPGSRD